MDKTSDNCPLCGLAKINFLFETRDYHNPQNEKVFKIFQCENCKLAFLNPFASCDEWLSLMKASKLYSSSATDIANALFMLKKQEPGKLLDIGCGKGWFMLNAKKIGWDVTGVELVKGENPNGLPIHYGPFEEIKLEENTFDAVTFWGVTEYVRNPLEFFKKVKTLLKDKGKIYFVVGNYNSIQRRYMKIHNFPRQQILWSKPALEYALREAGLEIYEHNYKSTVRSGRCTEFITFLYKKHILKKTEFQILVEHSSGIKERGFIITLVKVIDRLITIPLSALMGLFDFNGVINVVARKKLEKPIKH